jgi:hypothetical protein
MAGASLALEIANCGLEKKEVDVLSTHTSRPKHLPT